MEEKRTIQIETSTMQNEGLQNEMSNAEVDNAAGEGLSRDEKKRKQPKYPVWIDVLAMVGMFFLADFIGYFVRAFLEALGGLDAGFVTFSAYVVKLVVVIGFAIWLRVKRNPSRPIFKFSVKKADPTLILWGVVLVFIVSYLVEPLIVLFPSEYLDMLYDAIQTGGWAVATTIVAAPILEEMLFRGIMQETVAKDYGVFKAVILSAFVFGIVHIIPQQVVNAFFIGIILGYIYFRTQSLMPVIIIHAINNAIAYISMLVFEDKRNITTRELINNDTVYWLIYAVCGILFIIAIYYLMKFLKRLDAVNLSTVKK